MSFHTVLILINAVAIVGVAGLRRVPRRAAAHNQEPEPENLTPFFDDDVLEGAHLERVLGVALLALVVVVLGLLAYFIWEPFRETAAATGFHAAVGRARRDALRQPAVEGLRQHEVAAVRELPRRRRRRRRRHLHGARATIPAATRTRRSPTQTPAYCLPQQVSWAAPNLQFAPLRYSRAS